MERREAIRMTFGAAARSVDSAWGSPQAGVELARPWYINACQRQRGRHVALSKFLGCLITCTGLFRERGSMIDGGWWPRSGDLAAELPALVEEIFAAGIDVTDVLYNNTVLEPAPRPLTVAGHRVQLHGDTVQDVVSIQLVDSTGQRPVVVVVIPPHTNPLVAENALALAGRGKPIATR